jgi:hypothetical protein
LPYLGFLLDDPVQSVLFGRDRVVPILVPNAGRYCIHKLAVYALRSSSDQAKRDKDAFQAAALAAALADDQEFSLEEAIDAMDKNDPCQSALRRAPRAAMAGSRSNRGRTPAGATRLIVEFDFAPFHTVSQRSAASGENCRNIRANDVQRE